MSAEGHFCWEECDEGPHGCVCGNDCLPLPSLPGAEPMSNEEDREALAHAIRKGSGASRYQSILLAEQILPHLDGFHRTPAPALPQEMYAPEVFERMKALLQEAHGSPMRALRLAVSAPQDTGWEYVCNNDGYRLFTDSLESARRWEDRGYTIRRRRAPSPAGPWEPVPTEGETQ